MNPNKNSQLCSIIICHISSPPFQLTGSSHEDQQPTITLKNNIREATREGKKGLALFQSLIFREPSLFDLFCGSLNYPTCKNVCVSLDWSSVSAKKLFPSRRICQKRLEAIIYPYSFLSQWTTIGTNNKLTKKPKRKSWKAKCP